MLRLRSDNSLVRLANSAVERVSVSVPPVSMRSASDAARAPSAVKPAPGMLMNDAWMLRSGLNSCTQDSRAKGDRVRPLLERVARIELRAEEHRQ